MNGARIFHFARIIVIVIVIVIVECQSTQRNNILYLYSIPYPKELDCILRYSVLPYASRLETTAVPLHTVNMYVLPILDLIPVVLY